MAIDLTKIKKRLDYFIGSNNGSTYSVEQQYKCICDKQEEIRRELDLYAKNFADNVYCILKSTYEKTINMIDYNYYCQNIYSEHFDNLPISQCIEFFQKCKSYILEYIKDTEEKREDRKKKLNTYGNSTLDTSRVQQVKSINGRITLAKEYEEKPYPVWIYYKHSPYQLYDKWYGSFEFQLCLSIIQLCGDDVLLSSLVKVMYLYMALTNEREFISEELNDWSKKGVKSKRKTQEKNFRDIIQHKDPDKLLNRLHALIDGKRGADVGVVLLRAYTDHYLTSIPKQSEFESEFTLIGSWSAIYKYMYIGSPQYENALSKSADIVIFT